MLHHELWHDEAQVWCIVRDLNIVDIFKMSQAEGHPILWYIIILPFAKLGFHVFSMQVVSLLIVGTALLVLLFKSDFSNFQKFLITFSAGMLYYLPIVARNYALIPLALFLIAYLWNKRDLHPHLFLMSVIFLSQTHIYMLGCSLCLFTIFLFEKFKDFKDYTGLKNIKVILSVIFTILYFLIFFGVFIVSKNQNYALEIQQNYFNNFGSIILFICQIYVHSIISFITPLIKYFDFISIICFVPFFVIILCRLYAVSKKIFIVCICSISYILCVFNFVYLNGIIYQKSYIIILILLFCVWLANQYKKDKFLNISLNVILLISCLVSPFVLTADIKYNFSGGKQVAEYIQKNLEDKDTFIALGNPYLYSSISAYLPNKKLYNVITNSYVSYFTFKISDIKKQPEPEDRKYFIMDNSVSQLEEMGFKVIFESDKENISSREEQEIFKICINENDL